jgi:hypothetical protein
LTVGARGLTPEEGEEIWHRLRRAPDLAAKLQFALWAAYFDGGDSPAHPVWTSLDSMLARLGYAQHPSGGHTPRDTQLVSRTLTAMFRLAASGRWSDRNHRKEHTLTGGLWQEGLVATERRAGTRERIWITYQPGQWFADPAWRSQNPFLGRVSVELLELDTARDRWPFRLGAAYTWLSRANFQAGPLLTARVRSLVAQTGAASTYHGRPAQLRAHVEAALDRLREMGLLTNWEWMPSPSGAVEGWLAGSIRVEWVGAIPRLACSDTTPRVQRDHASCVIREIKNRPNKSNRSKGRPLTLRAGAAPSSPTNRRPTRRTAA